MKNFNFLLLLLILFVSCTQDELYEGLENDPVVEKVATSTDNKWYMVCDITDELPLSVVEIIREKMIEDQIVAITLYGEDVNCQVRVADGNMGLNIGDDGRTCGFNLYLGGSGDDHIYIVSLESMYGSNIRSASVPILFGLGSSSLSYALLEFADVYEPPIFRDISPSYQEENSCLYVIFATDYMPGGFGYYRRYGPYPIDIKNMYWSTINSKEFNARILHPCIGRKN